MLLGDEGADVIKVEQPGIGDYLRKILGQFAPDNSPMHVMVNRNKRSLTLDPRSADGADVFRRLIAAGPALTIAEAPDDPHLQAREIIVDEHHPVIGDLQVIGNPIRNRGETFEIERHAPATGRAHRRDPRRARLLARRRRPAARAARVI